MKNNRVKIRYYQPGDEHAINSLFNRIFNRNRSLANWRWKYLNNPAIIAGERRMVLAEYEGRVVGQYAARARDLRIDGEPCLAVEIVDNFIDPDFRAGLHLQKDLFTYCVKLAIEDGCHFGFGCPNEIAYKVGKRLLGYQDLFVLNQFFARLNWRLSLASRLPGKLFFLTSFISRLSGLTYRFKRALPTLFWGCPIRIRRVEKFDQRFDDLWNAVRDHWRVVGVRDQRYLDWRYVNQPDESYTIFSAEDAAGQLLGFIVLRIGSRGLARVGFIADFLYREDKAFRRLLNHAFRYFAKLELDYALCLAPPGAPWADLLLASGFRQKTGVEDLRIVIFWGVPHRIPTDVIQDSRNWFISYGDFDLE